MDHAPALHVLGDGAASCAVFGGQTWTSRRAYSSYGDRSPIFRAGSRSDRPRRATSGRWPSTGDTVRARAPPGAGGGALRSRRQLARCGRIPLVVFARLPLATAPRGCHHPVHRPAERPRTDTHPPPSPPPFRRHRDVGRRCRRPHSGRQARALSPDPDPADVRARHGRLRSQGGRSRWRKHFRSLTPWSPNLAA